MKKMYYMLFLCVMGILFSGTVSAKAVTTKAVSLWKKDAKMIKADITRDGKKDKIGFTQKKESEYGYISKFVVKINGKKALTIKKSEALYFGIKYMKMSKSREFLHLYAVAENDYETINRIYKYDKKSKKLKKVVDLKKFPCRSASIKKVKKNQFSVLCFAQYAETGSLTWEYDYSVTNNKVTIKSKTSTKVNSSLGDVNYPQDGLEKLFAKNQFKVANAFSLYTDTSCQKEAFVTEKDSVLKLTKLAVKDKTPYLMFEADGKSGWLKIKDDTSIYNYDSENPGDTGLFYGILGRLAG